MFLCVDATNGNFATYFAGETNRNSMWKLLYEASILKSDVYSFGMCIIEAHTGKVPFDRFSDEAISNAAFDSLEVCCPAGMSERVWALLKR